MITGNSDQAWQKWGEVDPYFAVLTGENYRSHSPEQRKSDFFLSGEEFIDETLLRATRLFPDMRFGRALDFGCGVGRLTLPLARRFNQVVGVDVSPAMLSQANENARAAGLNNVELALSDDTLSGAQGAFDFINTCIVLQHIPVDRGMAYIDHMLSRLSRGGVANIHFTVDRQQGPLRNFLYWSQVNIPGVDALANMLRRRPARQPMMQMNEYPFARVLRLFERHGVTAPNVILSPQESTLAVYLIGQRSLGE